MPYAKSGSHHIWYDCAGDGWEKVLLIMGLTMPGRAWTRQVEELSRTHSVAWFDHAGLGRSAPIEKFNLTMEHLAADAVAVLDALGWRRAHVVGISMGGMIAQHLALAFPRRVSSLTLAATHAGGHRAVLPPVDGLKHFVRAQRGDSEARVESLARMLFSPDFLATNREEVYALVRRDFSPPPPMSTRLAQVNAIAKHRTHHRLRAIREIPTMVIRPGRDLLVDPRNSDYLIELLPHAKLISFDDSGHAVSRQCPDRFNEEVLNHIESTV